MCHPRQPALAQGLQGTTYSEQHLLDQLLLSPSHMLPSSKAPASTAAQPGAAQPQATTAAAAGRGQPGAAAATAATTDATHSATLDSFVTAMGMLQPSPSQLQAPPRLRLFPVTKFTSSAVFGVRGRSEWLAVSHQPCCWTELLHAASTAIIDVIVNIFLIILASHKRGMGPALGVALTLPQLSLCCMPRHSWSSD